MIGYIVMMEIPYEGIQHNDDPCVLYLNEAEAHAEARKYGGIASGVVITIDLSALGADALANLP